MSWLNILFVVVGAALLFLLFRELVTWYWKIDEQIANQQRTNALLQQQNDLLEANNDLLRKFVDDFSNN